MDLRFFIIAIRNIIFGRETHWDQILLLLEIESGVIPGGLPGEHARFILRRQGVRIIEREGSIEALELLPGECGLAQRTVKLHPSPLLDAIGVEVVTWVAGEGSHQILFREI